MSDASVLPDPSVLSRELRDKLMHAARRHTRVGRVPLTREEVADLFEAEFVGIDYNSPYEDDWFFTDKGLKMAAACGFLGENPSSSSSGVEAPATGGNDEP